MKVSWGAIISPAKISSWVKSSFLLPRRSPEPTWRESTPHPTDDCGWPSKFSKRRGEGNIGIAQDNTLSPKVTVGKVVRIGWLVGKASGRRSWGFFHHPDRQKKGPTGLGQDVDLLKVRIPKVSLQDQVQFPPLLPAFVSW